MPSISKEECRAAWTFKHYRNKVLATRSHLMLCNPMDYGLPGSSVHRILQARILEWVAITFSRRSSQPRSNLDLLSCMQILYSLSHQGNPDCRQECKMIQPHWKTLRQCLLNLNICLLSDLNTICWFIL